MRRWPSILVAFTQVSEKYSYGLVTHYRAARTKGARQVKLQVKEVFLIMWEICSFAFLLRARRAS